MTSPEKTSPSHGQIILSWWLHALGERSTSSAKALSARLRRAAGLEALAEPAVHELARRLGLKPTERDTAALLRLALVLPWVREHTPVRLLQSLGRGDTPALSLLRFQRLMRAQGDEAPVALRRVLALADHRCNVAALGCDLLYWNDKTHTQWAFDYFGASAPQTEFDSIHKEESPS